MGFKQKDIEFVFNNIAKGRCQCCDKKLIFSNREQDKKGAWHAHHVLPLSKGENNSIQNMAILCINDENCHLSCAHNGSYPDHNLPQDWGKSHDRRRCWYKGKNGQCKTMFGSDNRFAYCGRHRKK